MTSLLPALPRTYPHLAHQHQQPHEQQKKIFNKLHPMYYTGVPIQQHYDLTQLKRSNIRSNDQLLPRPTQVDMTKLQVNQIFPAEHPYSSHMSKFALFPSFSQTRDDYKTGTQAQQQRPLHPQIPANPYDVTIHHKSKGYAHREETQHVPHDSEKKALQWPGDTFFQQVKTPTSGQQQFYPIPAKSVLPNHAPRKLDHTLNPRTANALRNVERSQWVTTYSKNFAGYGPSNALSLDNFDEKVEKERRTGIEDHSLRPRSYPTFMPPRPFDGRISRLIGPNQMVRCVIKDGRIVYVPWSPKIEIEMDQVKEHKNLPSETRDSFQDPIFTKEWLNLQSKQHPDEHLQKLQEKKEALNPQNSLPFTPEKEVEKQQKAEAEGSYLKKMAQRHKEEIKALTERTRWKQAEEQKHHDDLRELKRKVEYTSPALQPAVYYDTLHKIYSTKPPFYYDGDNPYEYDYVKPWDYHKTGVTTDMYLQEGKQEEVIREQLKNQIEIDPRYLREYQFAGVPGKNPYVMPKYTQSQLLNERPRVEKSVAQDQKPAAQSSYTHSYCPDKVKTLKTLDTDMYNMKDLTQSLPTMFDTKQTTKRKNGLRSGVSISNTAQIATGGGDAPLQVSRTTTANPTPSDPTKTSNLYSPAALDLAYNPYVDGRHYNPAGTRDPRFDWFPGSPSGPRQQTKLLKMQNSFTETDSRKTFLDTFPEPSPDLRENIATGKKHEFEGLNACEMH